jgi:predicted phage terminase large subunit-like protein
MVEPLGSKYVRALAIQPYHAAGNIFVPEDDSLYPWVEDFKDECSNFPKATHDDQVDAMTQAINHWEGGGMDYLSKITKE